MLRWFKKSKPNLTENAQAYENGRQFGQQVIAQIDAFIETHFRPTSNGFLDVLQRQCETCINPTDGPPIIVARIEYKFFADRVQRLATQMPGEIAFSLNRWIGIAMETDVREDVQTLIENRVAIFQNELLMKGHKLFIGIADRLKEADDRWRVANPELSAKFPRRTET
jgi:hypothetical protein